tara:strand:- start:203 stop:439 length:237 start_codon:yes stop_codon:yes gene_type:complete
MKIFRSIFSGPPKIAEPVGQSQLSATLAEQSRQQKAQLANTAFAIEQGKRGRRSLFSVSSGNRGAGFDPLEEKDVTLG